MQSATLVHGVPFRQDPRNGQMRVFDEAAKADVKDLNIKLPTGYGKTFTAAGVYAIRQKLFGINRLLFITPTTAQHEAFTRDGHHDLVAAGVQGPHQIVDAGFFRIEALKHHRANARQVFTITIQSLCAGGFDVVADLLEKGRWMIGVDEYHHYGEDKTWGQKVRALPCEFLLAMSATPHRPNEDSAFGKPSIEVTYRSAVDERAVKPLYGHSYIYKIDAVMPDGDVQSMTTSELAEAAGGKDPEKIEKFRVEQKMRWSPKYVSPLVSIPIERMLAESIRTGHRLQAIVGAMCVSHAELVCEQLRALFPELQIDWVGTGSNGRPPNVNRDILKRFCPPKEEVAGRVVRGQHTLDVLVHVGMAGEGLDTRNVSEIIHLNAASLNNSNNQENGRAARYLDDDVAGHINYDSSSAYAEYVGGQIMEAMDFLPPKPDTDDDTTTTRDREFEPLPDEPKIVLIDISLKEIDHGSPEVKRWVESLRQTGATVRTLAEMVDDPQSGDLDRAIALFRRMRTQEAEQHNERAIVEQHKDAVEKAVSLVTGRAIRAMQTNGHRVEKSLAGDLKKLINSRKKQVCGPVANDVETLKRHFQWVRNLEAEIIANGVPSWLR